MINKLKVSVIIFVVGIAISLIGYAILTPNVESKTLERFNNIGDKPYDFDAYTRDIWTGAYVELCDIDKKYYNQPEFYGGSWERANDIFYSNPDYSRWGVYGQGNIPKEISYSVDFSKIDELELCTFFHNGFGIWTYQGFELVPYGDEHFDIEITPNELTMSPTFPVFEDGWTRKIKLKIKPKDGLDKGQYVLGFKAIEPSDEYSRSKVKEVLGMTVDKDKYKDECVRFLKDSDRCDKLINLREKKYVAGGVYQSSEPLLRLIIHVE